MLCDMRVLLWSVLMLWYHRLAVAQRHVEALMSYMAGFANKCEKLAHDDSSDYISLYSSQLLEYSLL